MTESKGLISFLSRVYSMSSLHETQMIFGHKQFSSLAQQDCISYREGPWYEHQTIYRKCYLGFQVRVHSKIKVMEGDDLLTKPNQAKYYLTLVSLF